MQKPTTQTPAAYDEAIPFTAYEDVMKRGAEASRAANPLRDKYSDDLISIGWPSIAGGIILAGGAYPSVVGAIYVAVGFAVAFINFRSAELLHPQSLFVFLMGAATFAALSGLSGIVITGLVSVVTLPLVHLVTWSMRMRPNLVWLGAFSGGLVAFLAILPFTIHIPRMIDRGPAWGLLAMVFLGPALATIVGQIGGARGGAWGIARIAASHAAPKIELLRMRFEMGMQPPGEPKSVSDVETAADDSPRFRFRTIHLLWVGVWMSLLLTFIRISGIPFELMLPVLVGWTAYQAATLWAGGWLVRRYWSRWAT